MKADARDHCAIVYQGYRLSSGGKLRRLWSIDTRRRAGDDASIEFSPDGTMWATMAHYGTEGRHFALGSTRSMEPKRSETLVFHEDRRRLMDSEFRFLSSDGPMLLAPYGDGRVPASFHRFRRRFKTHRALGSRPRLLRRRKSPRPLAVGRPCPLERRRSGIRTSGTFSVATSGTFSVAIDTRVSASSDVRAPRVRRCAGAVVPLRTRASTARDAGVWGSGIPACRATCRNALTACCSRS